MKKQKLKISHISNKNFFWNIIVALCFSRIIAFTIFGEYTFDSKENIKAKAESKQALEQFINYHMNKDDFKYTSSIVKPLIADENVNKKSFSERMASEISGKSFYTLTILKFSENSAYYILEIPTEHPSEGETDFILTSYFKLIKKDNKWKVDKICRICDITDF